MDKINQHPGPGQISSPLLATISKQEAGNNSLSSIDGKIVACNTGAVTVAASALPTGASTSAKQDTAADLLTDIKALQTSGTQRVIIASAADIAAIITGANTGVKGLRVYGGPTDPISDIPVGLDYDHHQNHEGEAYQWYYYNATLNGTVNFRLSVPALTAVTRTPHFRIEYVADTTTNLYFFEGPTVNAAGTATTTIRNRNRSSTNTPGMAIYTGSTFTADGTELYHGVTVASAKASLSADTSQAEWILKPSTEYMVRIVTTGATIVMLRFHWYEDLGV